MIFIQEKKLQKTSCRTLADARLQQARMSSCRGRVRFSGFARIKPGD